MKYALIELKQPDGRVVSVNPKHIAYSDYKDGTLILYFNGAPSLTIPASEREYHGFMEGWGRILCEDFEE